MSKENETGGRSWYSRKPTTAGRELIYPTTTTTTTTTTPASIHFSSELATLSGLRSIYPSFGYDSYASTIS
jgi:hypothetical protein